MDQTLNSTKAYGIVKHSKMRFLNIADIWQPKDRMRLILTDPKRECIGSCKTEKMTDMKEGR